MTLRRRSRRLALAVAALLLATVAAAGAEHFTPGSLRLTPNKTRSATTLVIDAAFAQQPGAQLEAYNVDIARGFRFDPRAVARRCSVAQARSSTCPAASRIGSGSAEVSVSGQGASNGAATFGVDFYLVPPQRHGDLAGLVLAVGPKGSGGGFALIGRMVRLKRGPFGLELRFADAGKQLPQGFTVQLNHIQAHIGAQHRGHHLLTTPSTCRPKGWPFRLVVAYSTGTETYSGPAACSGP
jgi:hypothetical protein